MTTINWYPGHIAKAERKLKEQINLVDVIIEVIDARIPISSQYDNIEKLIGQKPKLIIINKADVADPEQNKKWKEYIEENTSHKVILTSSNSSKDLSNIIKASVELGKEKITKLIQKGMLPRPIRAMIVGMPNVGKSSIINKIAKISKAKVGAKAGVTRQSQWVRVNPKMELLDTPGIIPLKLENQSNAVKLAIVNSVSENAYDKIEVSKELIQILYKLYPKEFLEHYRLESDKLPTLEEIAFARNWIIKKDVADVNRCSTVILSDFRNGRIGRFTLDEFPQG